jgi:hypothetical protein
MKLSFSPYGMERDSPARSAGLPGGPFIVSFISIACGRPPNEHQQFIITTTLSRVTKKPVKKLIAAPLSDTDTLSSLDSQSERQDAREELPTTQGHATK